MAKTEPRNAFQRARSAHSPEQRRAGEGNASASGEVAVERTTRITVDLPRSVFMALRVRVMEQDTTTQAFVRSLIEQALKTD